MEIIRVSSLSNPNKVAGSVASILKKTPVVEVQTIGAGALNQAIKAIAIARGFVAPSGVDLYVKPSFNDLEINGDAKTAIKLSIIQK